MGGDHAPAEVVLGATRAVTQMPVHVLLVGQPDELHRELKKLKFLNHPHLTVVPAAEVVGMAESPSMSYRRKKESSIRVGLDLVKAGQADGFLSAGNTGAVLLTATMVLGKIKNIDRPAVATVIKAETGPMVMLDMGTNVDCRPSHLEQFALMGHFYSKLVLDIPEPRVALLSIGEEVEKGNELTQAAYKLIETLPLKFIGNIEGKDIMKGTADVIVCDGFVGNVLLKFGEGLVEFFIDFFQKAYRESWRNRIGLMLLMKTLRKFKKQFDYQETGGAPLLGVDGVCFIAHGKSKSVAIYNGIRTVCHAVEGEMVQRIAQQVGQ